MGVYRVVREERRTDPGPGGEYILLDLEFLPDISREPEAAGSPAP
ncbi:hypothetical protein SLNWT_3613 [Streptomyces albus]|uniref:Uncharacterized protein n=1 Tax=Streptomyces albus (strain ATCC 21838 / DSM 41398 / FERM P-419 / JCM 4703 / NBRC 107858) TaxID=1081613 RepID=A0A0B5EQW3_STRA4|nr:hypothetical protein SLNWT_3613 [Streptomyces albus]AOU78293.1 hypothetical protein SLNHY_3602 [Streptomyces albus]AYN34044.1 hypothetical protein DUI70_3543 [Streptomyces albus]